MEAAQKKLTLKRGRRQLSVAAVGIPAEDLPKIKGHHCIRSIPNYHLKASMEPVNVVRGSPSPNGTPSSEAIAVRQPHKSPRSLNSTFVNVHSDQDTVFEGLVYEPRDEYHLISALG